MLSLNISLKLYKTKVIIAFVLLFVCSYNYAQNICRDTNCVEFANAIESGDSIPKNFSGYIKYRYKPYLGKTRVVSINFGQNKFNDVRDLIKPNGLKYFENNTFKQGQLISIAYVNKGRSVLNYEFHDNGQVNDITYSGWKVKGWSIFTRFTFIPLIAYYKNGEVKSLNYFNDKEQRFLSINFYPNQNIRYKASYEKNRYKGIVTSYYENGKIEKIGMASNNKINGYLLSYGEDGQLVSTEYYKENELIQNIDTAKFKSQLFLLKTLANEENKNVDRKADLATNIESLKKSEELKKIKEEELRHQEEEIKRKQLELELLSKDKAVSDLTIKAKEAELMKNMLLANEKKKEIENLNQQKLIDELSIKNKESEIVQKNIESENKQKQIHGLEKEKELSEENLKQQKFIQKLMMGGSGLLALFLVFVFFSLAKSRKANKLIAAQKTEVENQKEIADMQKVIAEEQKDLAEKQKHLVEEKQHEIIESITYAKRLQEAILPPVAFLANYIPNNFVLYKPKDIVAGDFYWAEKIGDKFFIAAADSTGHGVPGAMVSVVCSNALNRSVKEFNLTETGKILDKTRELVIETFEKSTSEVKDGMDVSLLCIDEKNKKVFWSGANNPLWYIQQGADGKEFKEIKADKQPIGKTDHVKPFTTHEIDHEEGTTFYLFTDGFADQFGGPNGKKFKYKQFAEILTQIDSEQPNQQSKFLNQRFEDWKGDLEQVDDVCVIGVRI